ncbi:hypothetical protein PHLCEN_2v5488 [Hermanssonia centrifuga]|uniref:Uncharacterized protein n=1 Tax=Hermanssonia centrifuga TaxID=98765 RepID=A0A2R6P268_9APHY|nr:hypothetical protein PHLCEN_2v5488 [Hermanssonia centrifuga]
MARSRTPPILSERKRIFSSLPQQYGRMVAYGRQDASSRGSGRVGERSIQTVPSSSHSEQAENRGETTGQALVIGVSVKNKDSTRRGEPSLQHNIPSGSDGSNGRQLMPTTGLASLGHAYVGVPLPKPEVGHGGYTSQDHWKRLGSQFDPDGEASGSASTGGRMLATPSPTLHDASGQLAQSLNAAFAVNAKSTPRRRHSGSWTPRYTMPLIPCPSHVTDSHTLSSLPPQLRFNPPKTDANHRQMFPTHGEQGSVQKATIQQFHPVNLNPIRSSEISQHREFLVPLKPAQSTKARSHSMRLKIQHLPKDVHGRNLLVGQSYFVGARPTTRHMQQRIRKEASISSYAARLIHPQPEPIAGPSSTISQPSKHHTVAEGPNRKTRPISTYAHSAVHELYTNASKRIGSFPVGPPIDAHKAPATIYADSISDTDTRVSSQKLSKLGPASSKRKDKGKAPEYQAGESRPCTDGRPVGPPKGSRKPARATSILESISSADSESLSQPLPKRKPTPRRTIVSRPNGKEKEREKKADVPRLAGPPYRVGHPQRASTIANGSNTLGKRKLDALAPDFPPMQRPSDTGWYLDPNTITWRRRLSPPLAVPIASPAYSFGQMQPTAFNGTTPFINFAHTSGGPIAPIPMSASMPTIPQTSFGAASNIPGRLYPTPSPLPSSSSNLSNGAEHLAGVMTGMFINNFMPSTYPIPSNSVSKPLVAKWQDIITPLKDQGTSTGKNLPKPRGRPRSRATPKLREQGAGIGEKQINPLPPSSRKIPASRSQSGGLKPLELGNGMPVRNAPVQEEAGTPLLQSSAPVREEEEEEEEEIEDTSTLAHHINHINIGEKQAKEYQRQEYMYAALADALKASTTAPSARPTYLQFSGYYSEIVDPSVTPTEYVRKVSQEVPQACGLNFR